MNVSRRKILQVLFGTVILAGISLCASPYQDTERSYSVEGAWLCQLKFGDAPDATIYRYMDTYTSNSTNPAVSGTVLCTLHPWNFPSPMGLVSTTEAGQGNWIRIGKNQFAFTVRRIIVDASGMAVGTVKFRGTITLVSENEFSGTLSAMYYNSAGEWYGSTPTAHSIGKRIEVEVEQQQ
ncbi:MAG TPA: hypothetical protein VE398_11925 [Acidobacteriota bacterium]|nr:hypothetical protein [Acidobacteriota bacterium]